MGKQSATSISIKSETFELLQSIKSCFQLGLKKNLTYDEIIRSYLPAGISALEPKVSRLLEIIAEVDEPEEKETGKKDEGTIPFSGEGEKTSDEPAEE